MVIKIGRGEKRDRERCTEIGMETKKSVERMEIKEREEIKKICR